MPQNNISKVELEIVGLSYSENQTGSYVLVLSIENSYRQIPVIIGPAEAQSIAVKIEGMKIEQPLVHEFFFNAAEKFNIYVKEVFIYKFEEGIFYSKLLLNQNGKEEYIEIKTGDALAISQQFECPIYTTKQIIEKTAIILYSNEHDNFSKVFFPKSKDVDIKKMNDEDLLQILEEAVNEENYEFASKIRDEIKTRNK